MSGDRFNINSQLEHLQQKYVGTGHADASKLCVAPFPGPRFPVPCPLPRFPAAPANQCSSRGMGVAAARA